MTANDPFEFDDAAYVIGALSDPDRDQFEAHLRTCDACAGRVRALADMSGLLAGVTDADLTDLADLTPTPLPDTLLPGLLHRAASIRRRQRWLVRGLSGMAAACVIALAIVAWPTGDSGHSGHSGHSGDGARTMSAVAASPVRATAELTARAWGTQIDLDCHYTGAPAYNGGAGGLTYALRVTGRNGDKQDLGSWTLSPSADTTFTSGTSLAASQIASIDIIQPNGNPILHLAE
ncbi:MAG TPA: zf-HC2 domain-containing protein [Jatrophihabitantaceae bacterium]|jgi:hypothetical protein|nr:zf-HC2 domain-containing protein [Jatrophihabitantaceae bacterium]